MKNNKQLLSVSLGTIFDGAVFSMKRMLLRGGRAAVVCKRGSFQIFDLQDVVLLNLSYFSRVNKDEWNLDENYDNLDTRWSLIIFRANIDSKLSKDPL